MTVKEYLRNIFFYKKTKTSNDIDFILNKGRITMEDQEELDKLLRKFSREIKKQMAVDK